jgi:hypothetical protein
MPKPVLTLAAAWATFDALVFDDTVTNAEKVAARRVFYAGAQSILDILLAGHDPAIEVTEPEIDRVQALSDELRRFGVEVEARAGVNASAAREGYHWSPLMRMRQRASAAAHSASPCRRSLQPRFRAWQRRTRRRGRRQGRFTTPQAPFSP